jgi:hypothetical protein
MPRRAATFALLLVSTTAALLLAEAVLRSVTAWATDRPREFLIPHPTLGWSLQPGARYRYDRDGVGIEVAYNTRGWRDIERSPADPIDAERVVVLGDSFMEAYTVELDQAFHRLLGHRLSTDARPVEAINLGVSGYGTLQAYLAYELEGRAYRPDLVLLGFYLSNDPRDNSLEIETLRKPGSERARERPFLVPGEGWQLTVVDAEGAQQRYEAAIQRRRSWWWRLGTVSRLWRLTVVHWTESALRHRERGPLPPNKLDREARRQLELDIFACNTPPAYARAWGITRRVLERLAALVRGDGAELMVFTVPSAIESAEQTPRGLEGEMPCRHAPPGYTTLREILDSLGVPLVDLLPVFQEESRAGGRALFTMGDAHWNAAGHALAADTVAAVIDRLDLLPARRDGDRPVDPVASPPRPRSSGGYHRSAIRRIPGMAVAEPTWHLVRVSAAARIGDRTPFSPESGGRP